jgi:LPXTG-motif cell wall-anchored protein
MSDLMLVNNYQINNGLGEDGNTWIPALSGTPTPIVDRGNAGGPLYPANLGIVGQLDATWAITDFSSSGYGIIMQHWAQPVTEMTTQIQSVELLYDDAGCTTATATQATSSDSPNVSTLALTGENKGTFLIIGAVVVLASSSALLLAWRKKKI